MSGNAVKQTEDLLKNVIHHLYAIQACVHGHQGQATQNELVRHIQNVVTSMKHLHDAGAAIPAEIPPEIIHYVDSARNPDIYTREFVELVQRGNLYLKAKHKAISDFRDSLADEISIAFPELKGSVDSILQGEVVDGEFVRSAEAEAGETDANGINQ